MIEDMLKQLQGSLVELDKAKKIHNEFMTNMINQLPKDKKRSALLLLEKAKKGNVSIDELLSFTGKISEKDKKDMEKNIKKADDFNRK